MNTIGRFDGEYRWLSNFWAAPVRYAGFVYPTVEHAYQAAKTVKAEERAQIKTTSSPGRAKQLGRLVALREDWEQIKEQVMLDLLRQKFKIPALRASLLATGVAELIEGNYWGDSYWGVDVRKGGKNRLGMLLMQVRSELAREDLERSPA